MINKPGSYRPQLEPDEAAKLDVSYANPIEIEAIHLVVLRRLSALRAIRTVNPEVVAAIQWYYDYLEALPEA